MYKGASKFILKKGLPKQGGQGKFSGKRTEATLNNLVRIGVSSRAINRYRHYLMLGQLPVFAAALVLEEFYPDLVSRHGGVKHLTRKGVHKFLCSLPKNSANCSG